MVKSAWSLGAAIFYITTLNRLQTPSYADLVMVRKGLLPGSGSM